jgi:hypothetical protein
MGLAFVDLCYKGVSFVLCALYFATGTKYKVPSTKHKHMRNLLITGGAGFIGSHLVDRLLSTNVEHITVVDDFNDFYDPSIKRANIREHLKDPRYNISEADIRDRATLEQIFKNTNFDCLVHLAARAGVRPSLSEPQLYNETNVNGTLNLLELARHNNIKQGSFQRRRSDPPTDLAIRSNQRRRRTSLPYLFTPLRTALRLSSIFHGLWTTPTPGSRDSQIRQTDNRG